MSISDDMDNYEYNRWKEQEKRGKNKMARFKFTAYLNSEDLYEGELLKDAALGTVDALNYILDLGDAYPDQRFEYESATFERVDVLDVD